MTICVVDTGVTPTPDLDITARTSVLGGTPDDVHATPGRPGHGTVVAHFAAGKVNGWGSAGAFPHARIASVRVFPENGRASWQDYIRALGRCHMIDENVRVIVLALGGHGSAGEIQELQSKITTMRRDLGVNVVAAAGNNGGDAELPARLAEVFSVAAATPQGTLCPFSARGADIDIDAPGCELAQAGWDGASWTMSGTSFAAPVVAGVLAALRAYRPSLTPEEAEQLLVATAQPGSPPHLDTAAAFAAAGLGHLTDSTLPGAPPANTPTPPATQEPADNTFQDPENASPERGTERAVPLPRIARLPRPRLRIRRPSQRRIVITALNRPRGALFQVQVARRRILRTSSTVRLRATSDRLRVRFVTELLSSSWTSVPLRRPVRSR